MKKTEDDGADLKTGDTVWAKFTVVKVSEIGDVQCSYRPRPGHTEYAASSINAIFLWRKTDMDHERAMEERDTCLTILFDVVRELREQRGEKNSSADLRFSEDLEDLKSLYREFGPQ